MRNMAWVCRDGGVAVQDSRPLKIHIGLPHRIAVPLPGSKHGEGTGCLYDPSAQNLRALSHFP